MEYSNINIKEILNSSIQNLDVKNEAEKSTIHKLINSDTNNFHFYDILIDNDITLNQESDRISFINKTKNNTQIFKSIHDRFGATKILSNNQKKFMINANNDSIYDSKILNDMKKEVAYNKMLLGEM